MRVDKNFGEIWHEERGWSDKQGSVKLYTRCHCAASSNLTNISYFVSSQFADIKFALPKRILDMMLKGQLNWANETQEEHRRNGKEVDKETYLALAES